MFPKLEILERGPFISVTLVPGKWEDFQGLKCVFFILWFVISLGFPIYLFSHDISDFLRYVHSFLALGPLIPFSSYFKPFLFSFFLNFILISSSVSAYWQHFQYHFFLEFIMINLLSLRPFSEVYIVIFYCFSSLSGLIEII